MAVEPALQRTGIGRAMLDDAKRIAREWPGDAIRLDAYDTAAGAGEFYAKCGFREVGRAIYRGTPLIYYERCSAEWLDGARISAGLQSTQGGALELDRGRASS